MDKVEYGFRNVWYAPVSSETASAITYGTPKSFLAQGCGGISISLAPTGEETDFYADDISWFNEITNNGYDGDLTMTKISADFKKDILGMTEDVNGALFENADVVPIKFALGFEVQGNEKPTRTWYYYCSVARPNEDHATKEATTTPAEKTLTLKARPRPTDKEVKASMTKSATNETAFNSFFDAVYEKQNASI